MTQDASGNVRTMADAYLPVATKAFADLHRVERDKATRADRKGKLDEWAAEYYADTDNMRASLGMVVETFAGSVAAARGLAVETYNVEALAFVRDEAALHAKRQADTINERDSWCADAEAAHLMVRLCKLLEQNNED